MTQPAAREPLQFVRGTDLFTIWQTGAEYVGRRNGRLVARGSERGLVARALILHDPLRCDVEPQA